MAVAFTFPGQGSQAVGMGKDLADAFPEARRVFEEVDDALGEKLSKLIWEGPEETLTLTANAQHQNVHPAIALALELGHIKRTRQRRSHTVGLGNNIPSRTQSLEAKPTAHSQHQHQRAKRSPSHGLEDTTVNFLRLPIYKNRLSWSCRSSRRLKNRFKRLLLKRIHCNRCCRLVRFCF